MACASADSGASVSEPPHAERVAATASAAQDGSPPPSKRHTADDRSSPQANFPARRRRPASVPGPLPLFRATQERLGVECRPIGRFSPSEAGNAKARTHAFVLRTMRAQNPEVAISILRSAALVRADDPRRRLLAGPNKSLHGAPSLRSQSHPRVVRDCSAFKTCHSRPGHLDNRRSLPPIVGLKPYYPRGSHVFRAGVGPDRFPHAPRHGFTLAFSTRTASRPVVSIWLFMLPLLSGSAGPFCYAPGRGLRLASGGHQLERRPSSSQPAVAAPASYALWRNSSSVPRGSGELRTSS